MKECYGKYETLYDSAKFNFSEQKLMLGVFGEKTLKQHGAYE